MCMSVYEYVSECLSVRERKKEREREGEKEREREKIAMA